MINVGRDEAFLLLEKWRSERALISCEATFRFGSFRRCGRILTLTREGLVLRSDNANPDRGDDFVVILESEAGFAYDEPRDNPGVAAQAASILAMISPTSSDRVTFLEIREDR